MLDTSESQLSIQELKDRMKLIHLWDYIDDDVDATCLIDTDLKLTDMGGNETIPKQTFIHIPTNILTTEKIIHEKCKNVYIPFIKGDEEIKVYDWHENERVLKAPKGHDLTVQRLNGYFLHLGDHFKVQGKEFCACIEASRICDINDRPKNCGGCGWDEDEPQ